MPALKTIVEPNGIGHFLAGPYDPNHSAEAITLAPTDVELPSGTMLGVVAIGALSAVAAAAVSGTGAAPGDGSLGAIAVDAGAQVGDWQVRFTDPTHFEVLRPDGTIEGNGALGAAYNGGINFTGAAGAQAFVEDDRIMVAVTAAQSSGLYVPIDPEALDGSADFAAILYERRPISAADQKAVGVTRNVSHVNGNLLTWVKPLTDQQKAAIIDQAKQAGIPIRF